MHLSLSGEVIHQGCSESSTTPITHAHIKSCWRSVDNNNNDNNNNDDDDDNDDDDNDGDDDDDDDDNNITVGKVECLSIY